MITNHKKTKKQNYCLQEENFCVFSMCLNHNREGHPSMAYFIGENKIRARKPVSVRTGGLL
jgi:hypothetical protein